MIGKNDRPEKFLEILVRAVDLVQVVQLLGAAGHSIENMDEVLAAAELHPNVDPARRVEALNREIVGWRRSGVAQEPLPVPGELLRDGCAAAPVTSTGARPAIRMSAVRNSSRTFTAAPSVSGRKPVAFFTLSARTARSMLSAELYSNVPEPVKKKPTVSLPAMTPAARPDVKTREMPLCESQTRDVAGLGSDDEPCVPFDDVREGGGRPGARVIRGDQRDSVEDQKPPREPHHRGILICPG